MQVKTLYKIIRENGGVTVTPNKPEGEYTEDGFRLIADEGKALTQDGETLYTVIDVASTDGWYEVDEPVEPESDVVEPDPIDETV